MKRPRNWEQIEATALNRFLVQVCMKHGGEPTTIRFQVAPPQHPVMLHWRMLFEIPGNSNTQDFVGNFSCTPPEETQGFLPEPVFK